MKHLLIITFSGDYQGTKLEKAIKNYAHDRYDHTVCTDEAADAIVADLRAELDRLAAENPKCRKPELMFYKGGIHADCYRLFFRGGNADDNDGLLNFKISKRTYLTPYETLVSAVDDDEEV